MNSEQVSEAKTMDKVEQSLAERLGFSVEYRNDKNVCSMVVPLEDGSYRHANGHDAEVLWRECVAAEARSARLTEALKRVEFIASEKGHAPCRCGGLGPEGVCSNTCYCDWAKEILEALAVEQPAQHGEAKDEHR